MDVGGSACEETRTVHIIFILKYQQGDYLGHLGSSGGWH
jgi:hypothetical protein